MTFPSPFRLAVVCLLTLGAGLAPAHHQIDQLLDELDGLKAQFVKDKTAAKQTALKEFDKLINKVTYNSKGKAADRIAVADRLRSDRKLFASKEDFPEGSDVMKIGWDYGTTLVKKYQSLSTKFEKAMSLCIKNGDLKLAQKLKADKEKFDDVHLPGRKHFITGAYYAGTRYVNGSGKLYSFRVKELTGGVFKARAEQDLQSAGHPIVDVDGSLDGIHVECGRLMVIQGGNASSLKKCEGVVLGETLILSFTQVSPKGQYTYSYAILRKK